MDWLDLLLFQSLPTKWALVVALLVVMGVSIGCIAVFCESNALVMHWIPIIGSGAIGVGVAAWLWKLLR